MFGVTMFVVSVISAQNNLGLTGVKNARDLGGYQIGEKVVKTGKLFRSADLSKATNEDLKILEDSLHVAMVFDLRTTRELMVAQDNLPNNCLYINLPCLEQNIPSNTAFIKDSQEYASDDEYKLADLYLDSIGNRKVRQLANVLYPMIIRTRTIQEQYGEVIDSLLILPKDSAALVHCTNGKDRTGWLATFLLAALGADRETLVEEFMKSSAYCQPYLDYIMPKASKRKLDESQIEILTALVGVGKKQFEDALDMIDQRYGSMDEYITKQIRITEDKRERLRELFLE